MRRFSCRDWPPREKISMSELPDRPGPWGCVPGSGLGAWVSDPPERPAMSGSPKINRPRIVYRVKAWMIAVSHRRRKVVTTFWRDGDHFNYPQTGDRAMRSRRYLGHTKWPANRSGTRVGPSVGFTRHARSSPRTPGRRREDGGGTQQDFFNPRGSSFTTMKPDFCRPAVSTDSRVTPGCGLFAQARCQNGPRPETVGRFRDKLIFGLLAAARSRQMQIF